MKNFFYFNKMITPRIITGIYWVLLLLSLASGLLTMLGGYEGLSFRSFVTGLLYTAGGVIAARVWCELLIVLFKMNDALQDIRNK